MLNRSFPNVKSSSSRLLFFIFIPQIIERITNAFTADGISTILAFTIVYFFYYTATQYKFKNYY